MSYFLGSTLRDRLYAIPGGDEVLQPLVFMCNASCLKGLVS